jgi:hypothetical protein
MNIHVNVPSQTEADASLERVNWSQSIRDEVREVAWLSFIVATLSIAGAGVGVVLALTLEGHAL